MNTKSNTTFEGFKGEVFNAIKSSGDKGITFKELKSKFVSNLLDQEIAFGHDAHKSNLHATLLVLSNAKHVKSSPVHSTGFKDNDVFKVS